jgi:hypothetical protein
LRAEDFPQDFVLQVDKDKTNRWQAWLKTLPQGLKVGISWKSQHGKLPDVNPVTRQRNMLSLQDFSELLQRPNMVPVCLQYGDVQNDIAAFEKSTGLKIHMPPDLDLKNDQDGLAALAKSLDAVVGICSAPAALAASVGTPTFLLARQIPLSFYGERECPLVLPHARILKQTRKGDWQDVVKRAAQKLDELLKTNHT